MATPGLGSHHILYLSPGALGSEIFDLYKPVSFDRLYAPQDWELGLTHLCASSARPVKVLNEW